MLFKPVNISKDPAQCRNFYWARTSVVVIHDFLHCVDGNFVEIWSGRDILQLQISILEGNWGLLVGGGERRRREKVGGLGSYWVWSAGAHIDVEV